MDRPKLHKIEYPGAKDSTKALVFIPGLGTEEKEIGGKHTDAIMKSGWDGEIYYLWWDASNSEAIWRSLAFPPIAGVGIKLKRIRNAAEKSGRKCLPDLLRRHVPGKRVTFVAHSMGTYLLYKLFKKPDKYPLYNAIDDVISLGGAVSKKKKKWERTRFRSFINVYSEHDKTLKVWKYGGRVMALKNPVSPCGRRRVKTKYISNVNNVNLSDLVGNSHGKYHRVFSDGILRYNGERWLVNQ